MNLVARIAEPVTALRPARAAKRELPLDTILQGNCIAEMARLPDKSVDMIRRLITDKTKEGDNILVAGIGNTLGIAE